MASLTYALLGLSYAAVSAVGFLTYYQWIREKIRCFVNMHMLALGIVMLIPASMCFMWSVDYLAPSLPDFSFLTGFFAIAVSVVALLLAYKWTENSHLFYILLIYSLTIVAAYLEMVPFFSILMLTSSLVTLIAFLDLFVSSSHHVKIGSLLGSAYALVSMGLMAVSLLGFSYPLIFWAIPNFILALGFYMIYLDGKYCMLLHPPKPVIDLHHERIVIHIVFIRYLLYTLGIAGIVFVSTVSMHELGHALMANGYGCEQSRVVFDLKSFPHTELSCSSSSAQLFIITVAGFATTSLVGLMLWLTGENFSMKLGRLVLGYGFLIGYQDYMDLGLSENISAMVTLVALFALVYSFYEISRYYIDSQQYLFKAPEREKSIRRHGSKKSVDAKSA